MSLVAMSSPSRFDRPAHSKPLFGSRSPDYKLKPTSIPRRTSVSPTPNRPRRTDQSSKSTGGLRLSEAFEATAEDDNVTNGEGALEDSILLTGNGELSPQKQRSRSTTKRPYLSRLPRSNTSDPTVTQSSPFARPGPPRGIRDAYNKVVEAEAQQNNRHSFASSTGGIRNRISREFSDSDSLRGKLYGKMDRASRSNSPASFTRTRKSTPSPDPDFGDNESAEALKPKPDTSLQIGSGSDSSELSMFQNETDDTFNHELARHAKDQKRMEGALSEKKGVFGFSGAGRVSPSLQNKPSSVPAPVGKRRDWRNTLHRKSDSDSVTSEGSDPPMQAPRNWGSKSRGKKDWMSKIVRRSSDIDATPKNEENTQTQDVDWLSAAADVPIPSVEDTPSFRSAGKSPPQANDLDRIRAWEDEEFTARSIQVSTSPTFKSRRDPPLQRAHDKEIESLRDRAVTTNRLGEIKQRTSMDSLNSQRDDESPISSPEKRAGGERNLNPKKSRSGPLRESLGRKQGAEAAAVLAGTSSKDLPPLPVNKDFPESSKPASAMSTMATGRPQLFKGDSQDLLRALARASASPPPSSQPPDLQEKDDPTTEPVSSNDKQSVLSTPAQNKSALEPGKSGLTNKKTPFIMGGWIDTPMQFLKSRGTPSAPTNAPTDAPDAVPERTFLKLPGFFHRPSSNKRKSKSTTSSRLAQPPTQPKDLSLVIEDDPTLDSIHALLQNDHSLTSMSDRQIFDAANAHFDSQGLPMTDARRERMQEAYRAEKLTNMVQKVAAGLHSSKRGIEHLADLIEDNRAIPTHPDRSVSLADITIKPFALFFDRDSRLTWLSWAIIIYCTLYLVESLACYQYCHATYLPGSTNYDPRAPIFGWATLYVLEKLLPWIFGPINWVLKFIEARLDLFLDKVLDFLELPSEVLDWGEGKGYGAKHRRTWELYHIAIRKGRRGY